MAFQVWERSWGICEKKITESDRRKAAYQVLYKQATAPEVAAGMGISLHALYSWIGKYRKEGLSDTDARRIAQNPNPCAGAGEVEDLRLKIAALEMMIDIAEKELNIDIRKKSGTKQ